MPVTEERSAVQAGNPVKTVVRRAYNAHTLLFHKRRAPKARGPKLSRKFETLSNKDSNTRPSLAFPFSPHCNQTISRMNAILSISIALHCHPATLARLACFLGTRWTTASASFSNTSILPIRSFIDLGSWKSSNLLNPRFVKVTVSSPRYALSS